MPKTFASFAFGCRVNQAEKEEIDKQLSATGFLYSTTNPDFYIINSCAVTQKAEREVRQFIYQTRRKFPKTKIIVTGCAATKWIKEKIKIPQVDLMIRNLDKEKIVELILKAIPKETISECGIPIKTSKYAKTGYFAQNNYDQNRHKQWRNSVSEGVPSFVPKNKFTNSGRVFVKIQDGCQRFCTYCIVPYLRGKPRSISIKYLVSGIKYYENTIKEIILTAINTEYFGLENRETLTQLIDVIINKTKIPRLSFGSIHPWSLTDEFFDYYKKILPLGRLVNFFHVPLQSGSDKNLALMKRGYTSSTLMEKLKRLQKINPMAFIGTDVIVGFPGETEEDFQKTYQFLKDSPISRFHIFRFSPREGTAAYFLRKKYREPPPQEKEKRAKILVQLNWQKYRKFLEKHLGQTFPALFLEKRIDGYQEAILSNQIPIFIKSKENLAGEIREVSIEKISEEKLFGKILID